MTWEPSRKTLLVLRTGNKVEDRSDFLFSLIVFRRLHVFKLRFFLFLLRCLDFFSTFNDGMVFGAPGGFLLFGGFILVAWGLFHALIPTFVPTSPRPP